MAATLVTLVVVVGLRPQPPDYETLPPLAVDEPAFASTLEAQLGAPVLAGNRVTLLRNGDDIVPARLAAIRAARRSITFAQYFWADGDSARDVAEALAERCRAGVTANVLLDGVGTLGMPREHVAIMSRAGCHVATFRPVARLSLRRHNNRNHRRILVVDGRVAVTGGSGISDKWNGNGLVDEHWRDTDVRLEGPAVAWLQAAFAENWRDATHEILGGAAYFPPPAAPAGDARVQIVRSSPLSGSHAAYMMVLLALAAARRSILVTNPYFVLDARMTDTLVTAARRGVRVAVLTPGKIDHVLVRSASRRDFGPLLQAGIEIYEYLPALLHAKTLVVDGAWATVGSTNLDNRSFALNEELNVAMYDETLAGRLAASFAEDLRHARRIDYDSWRHRGVMTRLTEMIVLPFRELL